MKLIKKIFLFSTLVAFIGTACSDLSGPDQGNFSDAALNSESFDAAQEDLELLKASGVNFDSSSGVFSIDWKEVKKPFTEEIELHSRVHAIAFDEVLDEKPKRGYGGLDMGTISLEYSGVQTELEKREGRNGGFMYSIFPSKPWEETENVTIDYLDGVTYSFNISGSDVFPATTVELTTPSTKLAISNLADEDSVSSTEDLVINWGGGSVDNGIAVHVFPLKPRPEFADSSFAGRKPKGHKGRKGQHGPKPPRPEDVVTLGTHELLETNDGTYTFSADVISQILSETDATSIGIVVHQMNVSAVEIDGLTYHAILKYGDHVVVNLK
ncbi:MAG: hypothetical protein K9J12_17700 [Melioribacteraceae bacterium]|nr:hypothetical protein [Melioribacteraceae bacterium]MCF8263037.1 hypothetical protein [Melioribacteraceae bacterium]MCF8430482.1 hypothetical protein [Melioribacteraceae bacterium]